MHISEVKKLSPQERFLYWIEERHAIYLKRENGESGPWTDDGVLRNYFFTHPYRELDKVTRWFRNHIREPLKNSSEVLLATVIFRWFNLPATGRLLIDNDLLTDWNNKRAVRLLKEKRDRGEKIFTGAYMITSPPGSKKVEAICQRITNVWRDQEDLINLCDPRIYDRMAHVHKLLTKFPGLGGFMSYEIVCDLRYTYLLEHAVDKLTWCNPGPGCARGLDRLNGVSLKGVSAGGGGRPPKGWREDMQGLLAILQRDLSGMPEFEMREVEHSLCEWDKYERILWGDGPAKRRYRGDQNQNSIKKGKTMVEKIVQESTKRVIPKPETKNGKGLLRKAQIRILKTLNSGRELTRKEIAKRSEVCPTKIGDYSGPRPPQSEKTSAKWNFPTLLDLKYVRVSIRDLNGRDIQCYQITELGKEVFGQYQPK